MARNRETKIELTAYDDLFQTDESRAEAALSKIRDIPISEIDEFPDHPFKVLMDEDMEQLVESVKRNGVMTPATVRLKENGRYELISGHRRKKACELAGLETLKCEVKDLTRDEAIIIMVESNLQRSVILPSEKAFAYKMRLEAMDRQGKRNDLTSTPLVSKSRSNEELADKVGESREQIRRFIRLTELVPEILQMVDEKQIAFRPAVEISYLAEEQQYTLLEAMSYNDATPSLAQAIKMKMNSDYGDGANPVILKSEFILSLCEQLIGGSSLGAKQKSIIDRCTASVYRYYQQGNYMGTPPTLQDFREELLKQDEPEAQEIALAIELFTDGSLNTFAKHTNVDTHSRLICYDILDLGKQLQPIGMLVVLDSILNRITQNRAKGRNTFIFIDEIYLLFQHEYSANFLFTLWKRVRKYGAYCTGITQNVDDLLQSHTARTMLANSEFIIMLNQASTDRIELAKLLNISDLQLSYITNVGAGQGLLKVGSSLVPFVNKFPRNTELYKLMTTKFGEV